MKIVFFGTPDFSVNILQKLMRRHSVALVVTRPDAVVGRKRVLNRPPVKIFAENNGLEVIQPERLKDEGFISTLRATSADVFVVAAYGRLIPKAALDIPPLGSFNAHASLLPKYRGAAPIQHAILNGDTVTGITVMRINEGLDEGDMLLKQTVEIAACDTAGSLTEKLSVVAGAALSDALDLIEAGEACFTPQDHTAATYAPMVTKELRRLDFTCKAAAVLNKIRAFVPFDYAYCELAETGTLNVLLASASDTVHNEAAGTIIGVSQDGITVSCGGGQAVLIKEVIPQGKGRMSAAAFARGRRIIAGVKLVHGTNL